MRPWNDPKTRRGKGFVFLAFCVSAAFHGCAFLFLRDCFSIARTPAPLPKHQAAFSLVNIALLEAEAPPPRPAPAAQPLPPKALEPLSPERFIVAENTNVPENAAPAEDTAAAQPVEASFPAAISSGAGRASAEDRERTRRYIRENYEYIQRRVMQSLTYPAPARRAGIQGTVEAAFIINRDGTVSGLSLRKSSGADILDQAALDAIRKAAPFAFPPAPARIVLPVVFSIQ